MRLFKLTVSSKDIDQSLSLGKTELKHSSEVLQLLGLKQRSFYVPAAKMESEGKGKAQK